MVTEEDIPNMTDKAAVSKWKVLLFENLFLQELAGAKANKVDTVVNILLLDKR